MAVSTETRTPGITLLSVLVTISGVAAFALGFFALYLYLDGGWWNPAFFGLGLLLLLSGLAHLGGGTGLPKLRGPSWWLSLIASLVTAASSGVLLLIFISASFLQPSLVPLYFGLPVGLIILGLILLVSLIAVRRHFGIGRMNVA